MVFFLDSPTDARSGGNLFANSQGWPDKSKKGEDKTLPETDPGPNLYNIMGQRISTAGARRRFASLVNQAARGERIKITRYNRTAGVLVPKRDLEALERCEKSDAQERPDGDRIQPAKGAAR